MAKTKKTEIKEKNITSLISDLKSKREELFKLRMDHAKGNLKNTSSMRNNRLDIARILTAIKMQEEIAKTAKGESKKEVANG